MQESRRLCILIRLRADASDDSFAVDERMCRFLGKSFKFAPHLNVRLHCPGLAGIPESKAGRGGEAGNINIDNYAESKE